MNGELILGVSLGSAFAALISFGYGRRMTQDETGRVLLGMVGFSIALGTYSAWQRDFGLFVEIGGWFLACLVPVLIASVINNMLNHQRDEEGHSAEIAGLRAEIASLKTEAELARHSVIGVGRDAA